MNRRFLILSAIFSGLAVALGAFGAHGLEQITNDEKILNSFRTGVQYQMYHGLALLGIALVYDRIPVKWIKWAGNCIITGLILFSGSLYLLTFLKVQGLAVKFVGPITPLGGLFFIAGWIFLLIGVLKKG